MRSLLTRRLRVVALAAATVLLLTGCVKLDVDLTVGDNDTVSGTYILGIDRSLLQLTGQDADSLYQQLSSGFDTSTLPEGTTATASKYDQGDFVGAEVKIEHLPIASLNTLGGDTAQSTSSQFTLTHEGDLYQFHATLDTSSASAGASPISVPDSVTASAEIRIKMTFPGEVTETNGTKDGTSVTWEPKLGAAADLTATAKDSGGATGGGGGSNAWLVVLAIVAGLAVVAIIVVYLVARSRREHAPPPPGPVEPPGPPPGLGSLAPPTAPAASPPPAAPDPPGQPLPPPT